MSPLKPILLVEDNLNDIELVLNAFKRTHLPNPVDIARHGGEALDYLNRTGTYAGLTSPSPAFVLLDLKMPKVDGLEVLAQVKADARLKLIPVVMLTTSKEEADLLKSYQLGVNAYVAKPVDFTQFVESIRQLSAFWGLINVSPQIPTS